MIMRTNKDKEGSGSMKHVFKACKHVFLNVREIVVLHSTIGEFYLENC